VRKDGPLLVCQAGPGRHVALRVDGLGDVLSVPASSLRPWQSPVDGAPLQLLTGSAGDMLTVLSLQPLFGTVAEVKAVVTPPVSGVRASGEPVVVG
jgi:hypothetical protein